MANRKVGIFVMYEQDGKRLTKAATKVGNARIAPPPPGGVFYIRWYEGSRQRWKQVGSEPFDVLKAQMSQEDVLAGKRPPVEERSARRSTITLASSIEAFLGERSTQADDLSLKRWRWELELFADVCGKKYLDDVNRADCFAYMKWYQQRKKAPRTVYNRMVGLNVFLKWAKHAPDFKFSQRKDGGEIPDYAEKTIDRYYGLDLKKFFAQCDKHG